MTARQGLRTSYGDSEEIKSNGHLEKLLSPPIADSPRVNVHESEREQSGISRRQFCGVRRLAAIFRGAQMTSAEVRCPICRLRLRVSSAQMMRINPACKSST